MNNYERASKIDTSKLWRMPWTNSDNAFSWLEITRRCNLNCDYCYQTNRANSDKCVADLEKEMKALTGLRRCDTVLISGGEPLLHPHLETIVRMVNAFKVKPVIVTNGHALTLEVVKQLKMAGVFGFVFHVDSGQSRPGWMAVPEKVLNQLRQQYADMTHSEGLICGFNTTILPETLHEVPDIVQWTVANIHKVCANTLIPVRVLGEQDPWDLYVQEKRIDFQDTAFASRKYKNKMHINLTAQDIYAQVQKVLPGFKANAFLGGTHVSNAPKWLFANILGIDKQILGNIGAKAMELIQNSHHLFKGRFLSFLKPSMNAKGKLLFFLALVDKEIRKTLGAFLDVIWKNPLCLFKKVSIQSILILQPQDILPSGEQDLCDGCPNKTILNGRLVSMCRTEEHIAFGDMVRLKRKPIHQVF